MNSCNDESFNDFYDAPMPFCSYELCQFSRLASPFYDFYATDGCTGFPETEYHFDSPSASCNIPDDQHQVEDVSSCKSSDFESPGHEEPQDQLSYLREFDGEHYRSWKELTENQKRGFSCQLPKPSSSSQQTQQLADTHCKIRTIPLTHLEYVQSELEIASKTRIQWTKELHKKFIDCVNQLGGARRATPKKLLQLMETKGLTLFHIKSHLQKYRISQHIQEFSKGKSVRKTNMKSLIQLNPNIGKQLMEAVRQQLNIQSGLHEQLEVQKNLISTIEEQMRQLRRMVGLRRRNSAVLSNIGETK